MKFYRKKLGQHFLKNRFLDKVVPFLNVQGKIVLEIGVGRGGLTKKIAPMVHKLVGYEKDFYLYKIAKKELEPYKNVEIVHGDALKIKPREFDIIIGNLPFSISSKFLEWMISNQVKRATVVLQKDFVEKLLAKPGKKKYVALSVLSQYFYEIRPILIIPPNWFVPRPKIYSSLVDFTIKRKSENPEMLIEKIKYLFSKKKKLSYKMLKIKNLNKKRIYEIEPETLCRIVQTDGIL